MSGQYRVILSSQFEEYAVRNIHTRDKLLLAFCQCDEGGWWCVNIINRSSTMKDLIKFVKAAKEKNIEHKEILEKKKV